MAICDNCIHDEVCGLEGHLDEALTFCANKVADVQPVKRGRWVFTEKLILGNPYGSYKCSECMYHVPHEDNYCPNCGAKMDGADATKG